MTPAIADLVRAVYATLEAGDREALAGLLDPEFEGTLTASLPFGVGGVHRGAEAMIRDGWWALGRAFAVRAEPAEWIECADGRLLVIGRYAGRARAAGGASGERGTFDAAFAHLWTARGGRLVGLWQLTDCAPWLASLSGSD